MQTLLEDTRYYHHGSSLHHYLLVGVVQASQDSIGRTPFEVLYGHAPQHFGLKDSVASFAPELETWMQERELMEKLVQQHLIRAQ
jgi:hypothetical protein